MDSGTEQVLELEQDATRWSKIVGVKQKETGKHERQQHSEVAEHGRTRTQSRIEHAKLLTINTVLPCDHPMRALTPPYVSPITPKEELDADFTFDVGCTKCMKKKIDCYRAEKGLACHACQKSKQWCSHAGGKHGQSAS